MATIETVTVQYERKMSDGNYGSESVSLFVTMRAEEGGGSETFDIPGKLRLLKQAAYDQLRASGSRAVATAAEHEWRASMQERSDDGDSLGTRLMREGAAVSERDRQGAWR